jgi:hypothetical protein
MVFRRFSFLSRGESDNDWASAIPMASHVDWWALTILLYQDTQPWGDLARHEGCRPKSLNLCLGSRMGSCWLCKKSSLLDSHENEAQGRRNLEVKDAAEGYLTPEEPNRSRIIKKRSFNSSCPNNPLQEFSRGRSFTFRPKMAASGFEDSAIWSFKSRGL